MVIISSPPFPTLLNSGFLPLNKMARRYASPGQMSGLADHFRQPKIRAPVWPLPDYKSAISLLRHSFYTDNLATAKLNVDRSRILPGLDKVQKSDKQLFWDLYLSAMRRNSHILSFNRRLGRGWRPYVRWRTVLR